MGLIKEMLRKEVQGIIFREILMRVPPLEEVSRHCDESIQQSFFCCHVIPVSLRSCFSLKLSILSHFLNVNVLAS